MAEALTLTEATEILAARVAQDEPASVEENAPAKVGKGKELSLEEAASMLQVEEKPKQKPKRRPKQAKPKKLTLNEAAEELQKPDAYVDEAAIDSGRSAVANAWSAKAGIEQQWRGFVAQVAQAFPEVAQGQMLDDRRAQEFSHAQAQARNLMVAAQKAQADLIAAFAGLFQAEDDAFKAMFPDWSADDSRKAGELLAGAGLPHDEIAALWQQPIPINVNDPRCTSLMQKIAGSIEGDVLLETFTSAGFEEAEIQAILNGQQPIFLRDHRLQAMLARAIHADTTREDQKAA